MELYRCSRCGLVTPFWMWTFSGVVCAINSGCQLRQKEWPNG